MARFTSKVKEGLALLRRGHASVVWHVMRQRLHSDFTRVQLRRDLAQPVRVPPARIPVTVRPLAERDRQAFSSARDGLVGSEEHEWWLRARMLEAGLGTCYVAADPDGQLTYMQWVLPPSRNNEIQEYFRGLFPRLQSDEALLEGAYTFPAYRGLRIMPCAMAQIAERAADSGARWAVTFVGVDNEPSLKGCERAGFERHAIWHDRWRLFRRYSTSERIDGHPAERAPGPG